MGHSLNGSLMKSLNNQFLAVKTVKSFCELFEIPQARIPAFLASISYTSFKIKKKSGGYRTIEDPCRELKDLQNILNDYLQCVYFFCMSKGAHGFVATPDNDHRTRRSILSNAAVHLGSKYLLNIDLMDFFHSVTLDKIKAIFEQSPFNMNLDLVELLSQIVSFNGYLPMGAPTSPVLSNFAFIPLDKVLQEIASSKKLYYSRFVDDMSFSGSQEITQEDLKELTAVINKFEFKINTSKIKFFGPDDTKIITGISLIDNNLSLNESYLNQIRKELQNLKQINLISGYYKSEQPNYIEKYKRSLQGRLQFVKMVLGINNSSYKELNQIWIQANRIRQEEYGAMSWLDFNYY